MRRPVRILHFADAHLGFETYGRPHPETGLNTRIHDVLDRLDELVGFVGEHDVHLVCFAGDAFSTSRPGPTLESLFAERVLALADAGAAVLLLAGDHDQPRLPGHRSALDIYATLRVGGVEVVRRPSVVEMATRAGPVAVACLPYFPVEPEAVAPLVAELAGHIGTGVTTLLVGHLAVAEAVVPPGQARLGPPAAPVAVADVAHPRFPYVALGHIHRAQGDLHGGRPFVAYSGSLERADFGEEHDRKGFYVVDLEGDRLAAPPELVAVAARPFRGIDVRLEDKEADPTGRVLRRVPPVPPGAVVRVRIEGRRDVLAGVRATEVAGALTAAADVRIELRVRRPEPVPREAEVVAAETETAALEAWLSAHPELPDRDRIRARGRELISDVLGRG